MFEKLNAAATFGLILAAGWFLGVMTCIGADAIVPYHGHASHRYHAAEKWHGKPYPGQKP